MINIIIADDHPVFIDGLQTIFKDVTDIVIVGEAMNGKQVLDLLKVKVADIVLLDINMPVMDGLETAEVIKQQFPEIKIIMLTQYNEKRLVKKCQALGVEGYLLKGSSKHEIANAIRNIAGGGMWYKTDGKENKFGNYQQSDMPKLSEKENMVLKMVAAEYCNGEIAAKMNISTNTVRSYKERILQKTGNSTMIGLIKWATENGLI